MEIYVFDSTTGEYRGAGRADPSPAEPGKFLVPANATAEAPPAAGQHQAAVYRGGWQLVSDWRGHVYWLADGSRHEITSLEVEPPVGALDAEPAPSVADATAAKLVEINADFEADMKPYKATYPPTEQDTWHKQDAESLAWTQWADPAGNNRAGAEPATPTLDRIALRRGLDRETLIQRAREKADLFELVSSDAIGVRQGLEDQLAAIQAAAALPADDPGHLSDDDARAQIAAIQWEWTPPAV